KLQLVILNGLKPLARIEVYQELSVDPKKKNRVKNTFVIIQCSGHQIIRTINRPKEILLTDTEKLSDIPNVNRNVLSCALNDNHLTISCKVGRIPFSAPRHHDVINQ